MVVLPENDPLVDLAERSIQSVSVAAIPGAFWVDFVPWLKYVPSWVPGAGFRRKAKEWKELALAMVEKPYEKAKQNISEGNYRPSFVSYSLEKMRNESSSLYRNEWDIQSVAGIVYAGGSNTSLSALASFFLVMLKHPEIQNKAQAEIDQVLKGSLPTFENQESLPYVTAIVKEVLRWKAVAPLGIPHCLISEDVHKGHRIPAGSMVIANQWSMLYDEEIYPDPANFKPERFLKDGKLDSVARDPALIAFGFGRRICPGRYYSLIWITVASILATMDITKAVDQEGNVI